MGDLLDTTALIVANRIITDYLMKQPEIQLYLITEYPDDVENNSVEQFEEMGNTLFKVISAIGRSMVEQSNIAEDSSSPKDLLDNYLKSSGDNL